ncbi:uncharacterized protein LOC111365349 isoform X2 [Olea europaea var. sylvestris]|uniref:uncharacterized protein LOC111365349 isoform X2 n=1 Tax=Olea europaea var. sylvestris TaxID=158386 RepID=UPI000C1D1DF4|nr:uncharacterized protein LOC111365349 isoform X2 [Olea europaea var. sylvestris]
MALCLYSACLPLPQHPVNVNFSCLSNGLGLINRSISSSRRRRRSIISPSRILRSQILPSARPETIGSRVFVVSDLHTDYIENMTWVRSLSSNIYKKDVLIVAGDVAETCSNFVLTMSLLRERFQHVFFVPGNHDLWLRREKHNYFDSLYKLDKLLDACERLGVETKPSIVDGLGIIPLYSWYHEACKDFHVCRWPDGLENGESSLALYFDSMNDKNWNTVKDIQRRCSHTVSFSHFIPRLELCPEKRMLFYPNLPKIIGSNFLETRIRSIHGDVGNASACHVFGHTHFCWDTTLDGIRYVQAPLAYPRERKRRMNGGDDWLPFCIYADGCFAEKLSPCYWSDYYAVNPRTPNCTELAPWVARFYAKTL